MGKSASQRDLYRGISTGRTRMELAYLKAFVRRLHVPKRLVHGEGVKKQHDIAVEHLGPLRLEIVKLVPLLHAMLQSG